MVFRIALFEIDIAVVLGVQVGGGPTASYLFCFAKKGNPKKATTLPLAFGFPIMQNKKWESLETRYAQTARLSLSIFCPAQLAVSEVDESQKRKQKQKRKRKQKRKQKQKQFHKHLPTTNKNCE